ncbi:hypothetical protein KW796_01665 [Candidatus Parcubacteria bacterium]|nr:hypothetical protein [Candidatus Parcubacteria bacterium]
MATAVSGMRITSHAVGMVIVEVEQDGMVKCDRMSYAKGGRTSIRHLMETGEVGETVLKTLETGLPHEAARDAVNFSFELLSKKPILIEFGSDQNHQGGTHMKVFFAVRVKGDLRDFDLMDGDERLGPVTMVEIEELVRETDGKTVPVHVRATKAALASVAGNRAVFDRYMDLITKWRSVDLTPEQQAAIDAYPGKW